MTDSTENWSRSWKSSTNPSKQRKYTRNAPLHVKDKMVRANLDHELRDELGTRTIGIRRGDRIEIMRGDRKGASGIVTTVDRQEERVYVNGITVERQDGAESEIPLRPSNVQIVALNIDDLERLEKYDVDDFEQVQVDKEEMEEAMEADEESEMMKQMQSGESSLEQEDDDEDEDDTETDEQDEPSDETEDEVEEPEEASKDESDEDDETEADSASAVDYSEVADSNMDEFKSALEDAENPDYEAALEAEKNNKDRKTMKEWIERRIE